MAKKHFDVTSVDPSEYEPQVVELSEQLIQDSSPMEEEVKEKREREEKSDDVLKDNGSTKDSAVTAVPSKNARWLSKLQKLRQQFSTPPAD